MRLSARARGFESHRLRQNKAARKRCFVLAETAGSIWRSLCARRGIETDPLHDPVSALFHERTYPIIVRFNQLFFYSAKKKAFIAYEQGIESRRGSVQGAMQLRDDQEQGSFLTSPKYQTIHDRQKKAGNTGDQEHDEKRWYVRAGLIG